MADVFLLNFVAVVLELLLYGIYSVLFAGSVWVLLKRRRVTDSRPVSLVIEACSCFIFVMLSIHCGCSVYFRYQGLVALGADSKAAALYLNDTRSAPVLVRLATYGLSVLGMEVMLIYRLWIVWGRSWTVAALPAALTLFDLVAFIVILQRAARYDPASKQSIDLDIWTPLVFALEALTNLTCAVLISWRIIRESILVGRSLGIGVQPVLLIVTESAAVYVTLTLLVFSGILTQQPMTLVLMDVIPPVVGITSCLLIVRLGLDMANDTVSIPRSTRMHVRSRTDSVALKVSVLRQEVVSHDTGTIVKVPERRRQYRDYSNPSVTSPLSDVFDVTYPPPAVALSPSGDADEC